MGQVIYDSYILAVDSLQTDQLELNGKAVIASHADTRLAASRVQHYDHTKVLQHKNKDCEPI
jgi:hypothetical protein